MFVLEKSQIEIFVLCSVQNVRYPHFLGLYNNTHSPYFYRISLVLSSLNTNKSAFLLHTNYFAIQVNIGISNMGYLEYPGYVEVGRRSRPFSLYI